MVGVTPNAIFATRRPDRPLFDQSIWTMGTQVRLSVLREEYAPHVLDAAFGAVRQVNRDLSIHHRTSELSVLNADPGHWKTASRPLLEVARSALRYGDMSEGALDVSVLPVLRQLGFAPTFSSDGVLSSEVVDYTRLHVKDGEILLETGGYAIDFGGVAKGFAVDEALASLRTSGIGIALLDAGGDLFAMGRPEPSRRWRIGIRDPFRTDTLFATLEIEDEAVATSGTYAQTREIDGIKRSHLIDPKTGRSVSHVVSATVLARSTMVADALATAACVMSPKASMALIESLPETEALWIFEDGAMALTSGLPSRVHVL